jgi:DNA-binding NtrC family response regulator
MHTNQTRILIVDEDQSFVVALQSYFEQMGYYASGATSAQQAIELFEQQPYKIVLSNEMLPSMNGLLLLEELKSLRGDVMVIMMSETVSLTKILMSRAHGAMDFILKPTDDFLELDQSIRRAINMIERWNKLINNQKQLSTNVHA